MFAKNPQYLLTVFDDDDGGGGGGSESSSSSDEDGGGRRGAAAGEKVRKTMVIISLGQEHRRTQRDRKVKLLQVRGISSQSIYILKVLLYYLGLLICYKLSIQGRVVVI